MPTIRKVFKSGNSLVCALPDRAIRLYKLTEGSYISWRIDLKGDLRITPVEFRGDSWRKKRSRH